jgi:hypothetical protein
MTNTKITDDKHTTIWPSNFDLIIDLAPIIWVDDIPEIDPRYLDVMELS